MQLIKVIAALVVVALMGTACSNQGTASPFPSQATTPQIVQPTPTPTTSDEDAAKEGMVRYYKVVDAYTESGGFDPTAPVPQDISEVSMGEERAELVRIFNEQFSSDFRTAGSVKVMSIVRLTGGEVPSDAAPDSITLFACIDQRDVRFNPGNRLPKTPFMRGQPEMRRDDDGLWKVAKLRADLVETC